DLINAGKQTVTEVPGSSYFSSADSFAMVRGGHVALTVLGALEVSQSGDLANWMIPGKKVKGMGGAMDLVAGARRVVVITTHLTKRGDSKLRSECTLPLTGKACVDAVMTDYGWFDVTDGRLVLKEIAPDLTVAQVREATEAAFDVADDLQPVKV
ncbi:MAG: 3-oxoacid CoA-transferase subunit B, partial [Myxococcota bacterium]